LASIEPQKVISALGGPLAVGKMDAEAKAEALEGYLSAQLDTSEFARLGAPSRPMTVAELDELIDQRPIRRGIGTLFASGGTNPFGNRLPTEPVNVPRLTPMPSRPTLADFFRLRFAPAMHVLQSADKALTASYPEEIVLACLLHDVGQALMKADHGWWAAQLFEPYVSDQVTFAIRYHQALRFYPDPSVGYEYPQLYNLVFGTDYTPPPHTLLVRPESRGGTGQIHRYRRQALQATRRGIVQRQQRNGTYVADDRESGRSAVR